MHERAGTVALPEDLIDVDALLGAYYDLVPDPRIADQQVVFGTSGHRGSSLDTAFNEAHIVATTAAIVEYRRNRGTDGPLFIGKDTHALSGPAQETAVEVLAAAGVEVRIDARDGFTPTPAVSLAILVANGAVDDGGLRTSGSGLADGIVITPSHNPPRDGGFKYNPPHGGPADSDATSWIAARANELLAGEWRQVPRFQYAKAVAADSTRGFDFLDLYLTHLPSVIDLEAIRQADVRIGADPLGGAAVDYWGAIGEEFKLNLTVVNPKVDPAWAFMTLDWDGKIRMDCSSAHAMATLRDLMSASDAPYDIATGNDADSDRHGIVTRDGGLMNPNHYLAASIAYLYGGARPEWRADAKIGKTLVSSSLIDRVGADIGRTVVEVPVGFKWFVPGLLNGEVAFGGEESAGASFLRRDGRVWTTDKDGLIMCLLASEITATTGSSPSTLHRSLTHKLGESWYARVDAAATKDQKAALGKLSPQQVSASTLAGQDITAKLTEAPGNGAKIGGLKVTTDDAWFAARPSGTEDVYKIYAESFVSESHLGEVQQAARELVSEALEG
ncbi:phosphoglucomutase (alpha-D-glucose-1,6-bisphosphate-dependent) [Demequina sp. TTPB684]|uniref:phosphoglucomutase (alpha-D-glucose-1,6-bisphosphate-dependent) n=1 Tax=unclassified Demequina TaxID=2620311 RepID=UPI001CF1918A|nr:MULTISPECIES: phosphoglucomutase (alpha-D-glucose-1,6-bisphosphate-dependent) [unclassified Demequina]MCB2413696.1 phosphoglucomutase (alpha-D-glucose-1,6-bisphosphate-dependent) [Demequina sp. TTPB684]UPU87758.1 phosphoglucomutase (alpha-D-glucose-1,6-bisphosphate-dependent) [Demequina sp. TMPB413]